MRSVRQFAGFVGHPGSSVSLRGLRGHLSDVHAQSFDLPSLRAMIQQVEALTVPFGFNLDVTPQQGKAPLSVKTRLTNVTGLRIRGILFNPPDFLFQVLKGNTVIRNAPSSSGFDHKFTEGGTYTIRAAAQGVGSTGYARIVHTVTVNVAFPPAPPPPPPPPPPPVVKPVINVAYDGPASEASFTVTGSKFRTNHVVHIRVVNDANLVTVFFDTTSDSSGQISHEINFPAAPGTRLSFSANDEREDPVDLTGTLWSNTFKVTAT